MMMMMLSIVFGGERGKEGAPHHLLLFSFSLLVVCSCCSFSCIIQGYRNREPLTLFAVQEPITTFKKKPKKTNKQALSISRRHIFLTE